MGKRRGRIDVILVNEADVGHQYPDTGKNHGIIINSLNQGKFKGKLLLYKNSL